MSELKEKIDQDLKAAMIAKNADTLSVLRLLLASMHNKEIALRQGENIELADEQIVEVINSEIKKRKEAAELYSQGGRTELAEKEKKEAAILGKYLPEQISDEELEKIIDGVIASGAADFGKVMGQVMAKVKGKADGNRVSEKVKKIISK